MNEELLISVLKEIQKEDIRFGTCNVQFTFHDGRPTCYELSFSRRINIQQSKEEKDGAK